MEYSVHFPSPRRDLLAEFGGEVLSLPDLVKVELYAEAVGDERDDVRCHIGLECLETWTDETLRLLE